MTDLHQFQNLDGGAYRAGNSPVHTVSVEKKLALCFALFIAAGVSKGWGLAGVASLVWIFWRLSGQSFFSALAALRSFRVFIVMMAGASLFFQEPSLSGGGGRVGLVDVMQFVEPTLQMSLRLIVMIWISLIFTRTTSPLDIKQSLQSRFGNQDSPGGGAPELFKVMILSWQLLPDLLKRFMAQIQQVFSRDKADRNIFRRSMSAARQVMPLVAQVIKEASAPSTSR
ncbi:MAG: hypothetical protein G3M78_12410 [Candidatus Nitrohelix vancouverensis]|uniref:Uncharacterized protein n=1 Tax=Candidatus Nitrohelix vancouverensis TaxID=2705534 RepID=A0A7T0C3Z8_9BACT|nr:MAG: hypothetical protein G3M78_12410 [Candidatus Nitrohelix vancouverensis]